MLVNRVVNSNKAIPRIAHHLPSIPFLNTYCYSYLFRFGPDRVPRLFQRFPLRVQHQHLSPGRNKT